MSRINRDHTGPVPCWFCRERGREPAVTAQQCKKCFACCCYDCQDDSGLCPECKKNGEKMARKKTDTSKLPKLSSSALPAVEAAPKRRGRKPRAVAAPPVNGAPAYDARKLAKVGARAKKIAELEATIEQAKSQLAAELAGLKGDLSDAPPVARKTRTPRARHEQPQMSLPAVDEGKLED